VNLRGTLEVVQLARHANEAHGLRRFSQISTVAVAGHRRNEVVAEDRAIEWERSDYDPYARTKKFCEHMVRELLPDVPRTVFRPSIVLGDSRRAETTQFEMVRAFAFLAGLPVLPLRPGDQIDIVPVDYVARAVIELHRKARPEHEIYHLSSGRSSETFRKITETLANAGGKMKPLFWPGLEGPFRSMAGLLSRRRDGVGFAASLLRVFIPYLVWNTVFDNTRVAAEVGCAPAPFSAYAFPLLRFARENAFRYPYRDWPEETSASAAAGEPEALAGNSLRAEHAPHLRTGGSRP
jgi:nucleoside-diphosphate-sugar epimerase